MDEARTKAVTEAFVWLYENDTIYRSNKIVNWCPMLGTAISDQEVDMLEVSEPTGLQVPGYSAKVKFGVLYYFKYAVVRDDSTVTWIEWWMRMDELAAEAADAVKDGEIKIQPKALEEEYLKSIMHIKDWCLSRQIWWGHTTPAWYVIVEEEERVGLKPDGLSFDRWSVARSRKEALNATNNVFLDKKFKLIQDHALLDTWFSGAIWPLSILGWPDGTQNMSNFFPITILDIGVGTLTFWVARMIMVDLKLTGQVPFREDLEGRKTSKPIGNVIDSIDIIDGSSLENLNRKSLGGNMAPSTEEFQMTCFPDDIRSAEWMLYDLH
ncbi:hypothetical protein ABW20_dc0106238 [Dactylellina cionopaga]|nr:hypothetical protein ABW20_dc0106238 [Dactylellina cionopaga]